MMFSSIPSLMLGMLGESMARDYFKNHGLRVSKPLVWHYGDLQVDQTFIEVKTIRQGLDGSWSATIRKAKSQSLIHADFILLYVIADDNIYPYVIPTSFVPNIKRIKITSHPNIYSGKYLQFSGKFDLIFEHNKKALKTT